MRTLLLVGLLVAIANASAAKADASGPDYFVVVNVAVGESLTARTMPNERAGPVGTLPAGTDGVRNLGCKGGLSYATWLKATPSERDAAADRRWCRISWKAIEGWVPGRYLAESSSLAPEVRDRGSGSSSGGNAPAKRSMTVDGHVPSAPDDGGPRHWTVTGVRTSLNLRERPSLRARVIARYAPGTVLANLGCLRAEGRIWCDVQKITGGARGYVAATYLAPTIGPDGKVAKGPDQSALRAGKRDFDATGTIPCAQFSGQPMTQCAFGVARAGGGDATVVVTRPGGRPRAIYFANGHAIGADTSEADPGAFRVTRDGDLNMIDVGKERYEIPDAVVLGG